MVKYKNIYNQRFNLLAIVTREFSVLFINIKKDYIVRRSCCKTNFKSPLSDTIRKKYS